MLDTLIPQTREKMQKAVARVQQEFAAIRTGRATPAILDRVEVEYYGTMSAIKSLANISSPDARTLLIQPYDRSSMGLIEKAILKSDLGLTPSNDGQVIRIVFPLPTEERRKELVKLAKKESEEGKVAIRNVRRDEQDRIKSAEKKSEITQDDSKRLQEQIQKLTDQFVSEIDKLLAAKESEILEV
jgi:ribosome recycling factor